MQGSISDTVKVVYVAGAKDFNAAACTTERICLKNYEKIRWVINCGLINASSSAAVTLGQSTSDASGSSLGFSTYDLIDGETVTATAVTSDTFNITTSHSSKIIVIEIAASDLTETYDWVYLAIASPGSYSTIYSVTAELANAKYGVGGLCLT
jgi:hypothetical protein